MLNNLTYYIYSAYMLSLYLATALVGLILWKKKWRFSFKVLAVYACMNLGFDLYVTYLALFTHINAWHYNIWGPVESAMLIYFLTQEATRRGVKRLFAWYWLFLAAAIFISFRIQKISFQYSNIYESLFMTLAALIVACALIIDVMLRDDDIPIFRVPVFWAAIGLLLYSAFFIVILSLTIKLFDFDFGKSIFLPFSVAGNAFEYGGIIAAFIVYSRECSRKKKIHEISGI